MTSSLKFNSSSLNADAFNNDATSVSQFKEVISRVWPNVTADAVEDVVAEEETEKKLVRIRYSFDDYVVAHGATVNDAQNKSDEYKTSFVSRSKKQATNGKLQTHISDVCSGNRRRLQSSAFSSAQADPVACAAAIETETVSEVEVMNTAPSPNPTLSPTLSHAPTTYTPTTAQPSATPRACRRRTSRHCPRQSTAATTCAGRTRASKSSTATSTRTRSKSWRRRALQYIFVAGVVVDGRFRADSRAGLL